MRLCQVQAILGLRLSLLRNQPLGQIVVYFDMPSSWLLFCMPMPVFLILGHVGMNLYACKATPCFARLRRSRTNLGNDMCVVRHINKKPIYLIGP